MRGSGAPHIPDPLHAAAIHRSTWVLVEKSVGSALYHTIYIGDTGTSIGTSSMRLGWAVLQSDRVVRRVQKCPWIVNSRN